MYEVNVIWLMKLIGSAADRNWIMVDRYHRQRDRLESRRYSNLMDLPGVNVNNTNKANQWVDQEFSIQERRFFKDFRPFFLLCQVSGMFPNKLNWKLSFSWGYWATYFCLLNLIMMFVLLIFYCSQVNKSVKVNQNVWNILTWGCHGGKWEGRTSVCLLQPSLVCSCGALYWLHPTFLPW